MCKAFIEYSIFQAANPNGLMDTGDFPVANHSKRWSDLAMSKSRSNKHPDLNLFSQREALARQRTERDINGNVTPIASSSFSMNERADEEITDSDYKKNILANHISRPSAFSSHLPSAFH
jgi:hypothetical protein